MSRRAFLFSKDELLYREMERRRERSFPIDDPSEYTAEAVRHQQSMAGPAMMFVDITPTQTSGEAWDEESIAYLGRR